MLRPLLALAAACLLSPPLNAGATGGATEGRGEKEVEFRGEEVAVIAVYKFGGGTADELQVYGPDGKLVLSEPLRLNKLSVAVWTPPKTGKYSIRFKNAPNVCDWKTN